MSAKAKGRVTVLVSRHLDAISRGIRPREMAREMALACRSYKAPDADHLAVFFIENFITLATDAAETLITERFRNEFTAFLDEANGASWTQEMVIEEMMRSFTRAKLLPDAIAIAAETLGIADRVGITVARDGNIVVCDALADQRAPKPLFLSRHIEEIAKRISIEDVAQKIVLVAESLGGPEPEDIARYILADGDGIAEDAVHAVMRERFRIQLLAFYREAEGVCLDWETTEAELDAVIQKYRLKSRALHRARQSLQIEDHIREIERKVPTRRIPGQRAVRPEYLN